MEVTLPSGFTADRDSLPSLEVSQNVQKVETSHGDTKVILYFNNLTVTEYCPTVSAFRTHKVAKQKPVSVVIYDYYDTCKLLIFSRKFCLNLILARRARIFYRGPRATLCDICEGEDCGDICEAAFRAQKSRDSEDDDDNDMSSSTLTRSVPLIILTPLILLRLFR